MEKIVKIFPSSAVTCQCSQQLVFIIITEDGIVFAVRIPWEMIVYFKTIVSDELILIPLVMVLLQFADLIDLSGS